MLTKTGILSSRVIQSAAPSEGGNLVLLAGKDCRSAEWSKVDDPSENLLTDASESYNRKKRALVDLNYQLRCYQNGLDGSSCGTYRKPKLQYGFTNVAPCPFTSDVCTSENNTIVLDSGLVDSATDLGFNGNPSFQVRQTRACSPLKADRFKRNVTTEDGDTVLGYFLPVSSPSNASDTMLWRIPYPKAPSYNANISLSADYRTG